jgi:phage I-like protein
LFGAAILNDPFLTELPAVAAAENPKPRGTMNRELICAAFGLPDDATDEQINEKAKGFKPAAPSDDKQAFAERAAKLTAAESAVVKLTAELDALRSSKKADDVRAFFDRLVTEGRVTPAMREGLEKIAMAAGLDAVKFLESNPVIVPAGEKGASTGNGADAQVKWDAKLAELESKGMKPLEAFNAAKAALPAEWNTLSAAVKITRLSEEK